MCSLRSKRRARKSEYASSRKRNGTVKEPCMYEPCIVDHVQTHDSNQSCECKSLNFRVDSPSAQGDQRPCVCISIKLKVFVEIESTNPAGEFSKE